MIATQTQKGKAFEYSCLNAIYHLANIRQHVEIVRSVAFETARGFYESSNLHDREMMDRAANAAAIYIARLEPQLTEPTGNDPMFLSIQDDSRGIIGDVRDIICYKNLNSWGIGLSCKHNHSAVKHSRLSNDIDFGEKWFSQPCSQTYFSEIDPIFRYLRELKEEDVRWNSLLRKEDVIYLPLLVAFCNELERLDARISDDNNHTLRDSVPAALIKYLLGHNDFYKVISNERNQNTTIQAFNFGGTLNRPSGDLRSHTIVRRFPLPTRFLDISFKRNSKNTILITCDEGWVLSFRIHSASTRVEPSLKFDIQLLGQPSSLHTHDEPWY